MAESTATDGFQIAAIGGGRPMTEQRRPPITISDFGLFGDFKSVVDLDTQIPYGRFKL